MKSEEIERRYAVRFTRKSSAAIRILLLLPLISCGQRKMSSDELSQNPVFAEIIQREAGRVLGEDGFFPRNLFSNPHSGVRTRCAIALGRIGDRRALPWLYTALHAGDTPVRAVSAFALGEIEDRERLEERHLSMDPRTLPELLRLLDDPSLLVQMRAIEALGKTGRQAEAAPIISRLEQFPFDGSPGGRAYLDYSMAALARLGNPAAFPILEKLSAAANPDLRWRALDAIVRLQDKSTQPLFVQTPPDPKVRIRLPDSVCIAWAASRINRTTAIIETSRGVIEIELFREDAPITTANFIALANRGAFKGLRFSNVAPSSLVQVEEPTIRAEPGPNIGSEINMRPFERGSVGMALAARDTQSNSFFIALNPQPGRDGRETCFGRVISGIQAADGISPGDYIKKVQIKEITGLFRK